MKWELIKKFKQWRANDENEKIIAAILALPEDDLDDDIMSWLAEAYIDIDEYKKAIAVLESQRERMEEDYRWHFRLGLALMRAAEDEECEDDDELKENILTRAKVALARGMNMNPPENVLETADRYMEQIEDMLDELNGTDDDEDDEGDSDQDFYEEEEMDAIEEHIKEYYGDFPTVFHEIASPDIHCDICIVPPTEEKNYYTLLTMGMGARVMDIPEDLDPAELGRAELLICLPPNWKVGENSEEWFWPIALLKNLARLPINCDSWLGWGHSIDNQSAFAQNTGLCGSLLIYPEGVADGADRCTLPNGDIVNFFEVIPLYREEMDFKIQNGTKPLLEQMQNVVGHILNIDRPNCCEDFKPMPHNVIDCISDHGGKIIEKKLSLDYINGANHIAIFLRWCIEHKLIAPEFYENCPDVVEGVLSGRQTDLRSFIYDYFDGELAPFQLNFLGAGFAHYYYNYDRTDTDYFYPSDIDKYARDYFGDERYNSEEFRDEAYMFVPFDEEYYQGMSKYIERAFLSFYPSFADYQYKCDMKLLERVEKGFGIKADAVRHFDDIKKELTLAISEHKGTEIVPMVLSVDGGGTVTEPDELTEMLEDTLNPFLETVAIAKLPKEYINSLGSKYMNLQKPQLMPQNEHLTELRSKAKELFGMEPAILTFDEKGSSLFMPYNDGYIRFMGEGAEGE